MANMRIQKLPANQAWVVTFGDSIIRPSPDLPMFWDRRADLVSALDSLGIEVIDRKGTIRSKETVIS